MLFMMLYKYGYYYHDYESYCYIKLSEISRIPSEKVKVNREGYRQKKAKWTWTISLLGDMWAAHLPFVGR